MKMREKKRKKIAFYGHFNSTNFGNECTLQAILYHLRFYLPDAEVTCITTGPEAAAATHQIKSIPISVRFVKSWLPQNPLLRLLRGVFIGIPSELYRWIEGLTRLWPTNVLIVPGTGLLTDAYGLLYWGPYNLFKWSLIAKICRCKLLLVSVGGGPIDSTLGRWLVKAILSLADFRSYRDDSTMKYLKSIGYRADEDPVYPDLAFSFPVAAIPDQHIATRHRPVIGLGLMGYAGTYRIPRPATYEAYLDNLASVVRSLLARENDVRLLIGDVNDVRTVQEFRGLLRKRLPVFAERHIIDEPILSVSDLLSKIAATDIVIATRFHNVLLALLCEKPVISISFHHKCDSLMNAMGLSAYCLDISDWNADLLIEKLCDIELNAKKLKALIRKNIEANREALDEQYRFIFNNVRCRPNAQ